MHGEIATSASKNATDIELLRSYSQWKGEAERLFTNTCGVMERLRTESILQRFAQKPPAVIYDIGGGAGFFASAFLAGYEFSIKFITAEEFYFIEKSLN